MKKCDISGEVEFTVSKNYRVVLPTFCKAESDDKVVILAREDCIEVWDFIAFYNFIDMVKKTNEIDNITSFVYNNYASVDVNKSINLTSDLVKKYGLKNGVRIEGHGDHICIFKKEQCLYIKGSDSFCLSVNLWENRRVYITILLKKSNINSSKVVLVPKKNFIEVYDYYRYIDLMEEAKRRFQQESTIENKKYLDSLLFILKNRCYDVLTMGKCSNCIYIPLSLIDYYDFNVKVCLESKDGYFRIWEPSKFQLYQEQRRKEETRELFIRKVQERKLKRNNH